MSNFIKGLGVLVAVVFLYGVYFRPEVIFYRDNSLDLSAIATANTVPTKNGLYGSYFNNVDFTENKLNRIDSRISFNWGYGAPSKVNSNTFSVRWTGYVKAPTTGNYTFYIRSDDGVRLWVNGVLLVDNWSDKTSRGSNEKSATIALTKDQYYPIKIEYYENKGEASVRLYWSHGSTSKQIVPNKNLFASETVPPTPIPTPIPTPTPTPTPTSTPPTPTPTPNPTPTTGIYRPALNTSWQWQLTTPVDQTVNVEMFDIDLFENDKSVVDSLHAKGKKVICYMSAGSWEDWRPDANSFPASVKGSSNGWPGEKWLDIRQIAVLQPIMEARFDLCKQKGFDGVEPDNIDGYTNKTGFPLTGADQLAYNKMLAKIAHDRGLSIGLKNDLDQVKELVSHFDWALNEQCFQYNECDSLSEFVKAGKAVFVVEYSLATSKFCAEANALNFNALKKNLDLDAPRTACR